MEARPSSITLLAPRVRDSDPINWIDPKVVPDDPTLLDSHPVALDEINFPLIISEDPSFIVVKKPDDLEYVTEQPSFI